MTTSALERQPRRIQRRATRSYGWASWSPIVLGSFLGWWASTKDWGPGGENVPYLGAAICFLALMPALRWGILRSRCPEKVGRVPFFPVLGVLYALYFGAPVLWKNEFTPHLLYQDFQIYRALAGFKSDGFGPKGVGFAI